MNDDQELALEIRAEQAQLDILEDRLDAWYKERAYASRLAGGNFVFPPGIEAWEQQQQALKYLLYVSESIDKLRNRILKCKQEIEILKEIGTDSETR